MYLGMVFLGGKRGVSLCCHETSSNVNTNCLLLLVLTFPLNLYSKELLSKLPHLFHVVECREIYIKKKKEVKTLWSELGGPVIPALSLRWGPGTLCKFSKNVLFGTHHSREIRFRFYSQLTI